MKGLFFLIELKPGQMGQWYQNFINTIVDNLYWTDGMGTPAIYPKEPKIR
jgi:hypothetical protein